MTPTGGSGGGGDKPKKPRKSRRTPLSSTATPTEPTADEPVRAADEPVRATDEPVRRAGSPKEVVVTEKRVIVAERDPVIAEDRRTPSAGTATAGIAPISLRAPSEPRTDAGSSETPAPDPTPRTRPDALPSGPPRRDRRNENPRLGDDRCGLPVVQPHHATGHRYDVSRRDELSGSRPCLRREAELVDHVIPLPQCGPCSGGHRPEGHSHTRHRLIQVEASKYIF